MHSDNQPQLFYLPTTEHPSNTSFSSNLSPLSRNDLHKTEKFRFNSIEYYYHNTNCMLELYLQI